MRNTAHPICPRIPDPMCNTKHTRSQENIVEYIQPWQLVIVIALMLVFIPLPRTAEKFTDRHIRIEASRFNYSPSELYVNPGDKVTIELVSNDVTHGFSLDSYGLNLTAIPGRSARVTFVADHPGAFRWRCTVTCGNMHPFMIGKLQVGPNLLLWRAITLGILAVAAVFLSVHK